MGLFADLLAVSENAPLATPATLATLATPATAATPFRVAESQKSQATSIHATTVSRRVAEVASGPVSAIEALEHFAKSQGIDWTAARSQMIEGDAEAGAAQLAADMGDGIEHAGVACWLRLLAERAPPTYDAWPTGYREGGTGLDTYGRSLPLARASVTCGSCQHFQPNRDNPEAGIGACKLGEPDMGGWPYFPGCVRCCPAFEVQP